MKSIKYKHLFPLGFRIKNATNDIQEFNLLTHDESKKNTNLTIECLSRIKGMRYETFLNTYFLEGFEGLPPLKVSHLTFYSDKVENTRQKLLIKASRPEQPEVNETELNLSIMHDAYQLIANHVRLCKMFNFDHSSYIKGAVQPNSFLDVYLDTYQESVKTIEVNLDNPSNDISYQSQDIQKDLEDINTYVQETYFIAGIRVRTKDINDLIGDLRIEVLSDGTEDLMSYEDIPLFGGLEAYLFPEGYNDKIKPFLFESTIRVENIFPDHINLDKITRIGLSLQPQSYARIELFVCKKENPFH